MKIIHIISKLAAAGAESIAINLAIHQSSKAEVYIITLGVGDEADVDVINWQRNLLNQYGVTLIELKGRSFRRDMLLLPYILSKKIRGLKPDIVHSHTDRPDIVVSLASRIAKFNIVRTIHNTKIWDTWWLPGYISETGLSDDLIVYISEDTKKTYKELRSKYYLGESKFQHLINNGVSVPYESQWVKRNNLRSIYGINVEKLQVAFFGRMSLQKGCDILMKAIEMIDTNEIEFHFFGSGEELVDLERRARMTDLPVKFHKPVALAPATMHAFDLVVMPSRYEGVGLVSLESQMVGTPVLIADAPGLRESVCEGWPLRVPVEDPFALSKMLRDVAKGCYDLNGLGLKAREWAGDFSVKKMCDQYDLAYENYLRDKA